MVLGPLVDPAIEWATATGPPNWIFLVALLSAPHLWARHVKRGVANLYNRYLGSTE